MTKLSAFANLLVAAAMLPAVSAAEWTNNGGGGDVSSTNSVTQYMWAEPGHGRYVNPEVCYVRWTRARDAVHMEPVAMVTITAAEYEVLTNAVSAMYRRHVRIVDRVKRRHEEDMSRQRERERKEYDEKRKRGVLRVRDIIRARTREKKGGAK